MKSYQGDQKDLIDDVINDVYVCIYLNISNYNGNLRAFHSIENPRKIADALIRSVTSSAGQRPANQEQAKYVPDPGIMAGQVPFFCLCCILYPKIAVIFKFPS